MLRSSRRTGFAVLFLGLLAVCLSLHDTPVVAGKDAPAATGKAKRRPEKPKKKKNAEESSSTTPTETRPATGDNGSGLPASVPGGIPSLPTTGGPAVRSNGKGPSSGVTSSQEKQPVGKTAAPSEQGPNPELVQKVMDIQNRATPDLMSQKGIVGTSTGLDDDDNVVIRIYTTGADSPKIPKSIEGIPVVEVMNGPIFKAQSIIPIQQQRLTRPVPIGVSVFADIGCSTGTLGCRLVDSSGNVYALSTNHVFAGDTSTINGMSTGNKLGTNIVQPSPGDDNCATGIATDVIGSLAAVINVVADGTTQNQVDAAIMNTTKASVNTQTPAGGYGIPASNLVNNGRVIVAAPFTGQIVTTAPFLGQKLQKFGRTSGYTQGQVTAINGQITIPYGNGNAVFVNQIEVVAIGSSTVFATFGDSGALAVDFFRNPVGLVFASNGSNAFANPIGPVLNLLSFKIGSQLSTGDPNGSPLGGGLPTTGGGGGGIPTGPQAVPIQKEGRSLPNSP
jgi:hypothetical protein